MEGAVRRPEEAREAWGAPVVGSNRPRAASYVVPGRGEVPTKGRRGPSPLDALGAPEVDGLRVDREAGRADRVRLDRSDVRGPAHLEDAER